MHGTRLSYQLVTCLTLGVGFNDGLRAGYGWFVRARAHYLRGPIRVA